MVIEVQHFSSRGGQSDQTNRTSKPGLNENNFVASQLQTPDSPNPKMPLHYPIRQAQVILSQESAATAVLPQPGGSDSLRALTTGNPVTGMHPLFKKTCRK